MFSVLVLNHNSGFGRALGPNVSTTPIMAMGCWQCLPLSVVQLKGKHCRKPHCFNGIVDTFRLGCSSWLDKLPRVPKDSDGSKEGKLSDAINHSSKSCKRLLQNRLYSQKENASRSRLICNFTVFLPD